MYKQAITNAGLCCGTSGPINHFEILKLMLFHSFARAICNVGAPIQFIADISEHLLITHCKNPFERTNHQWSMYIYPTNCPSFGLGRKNVSVSPFYPAIWAWCFAQQYCWWGIQRNDWHWSNARVDLTCFPHGPCYFSLERPAYSNHFLKGIVYWSFTICN